MPGRDPWDNYRRRRLLWWLTALGFVPFVVAAAIALSAWAGVERPVPFLVVGWGALFMLASTLLYGFPCPRCGKPYRDSYPKSLWNRGARSGRCVHCHLPKWERPEAAGPAG